MAKTKNENPACKWILSRKTHIQNLTLWQLSMIGH